ncbi:MAG: polysaccharide biosynthesis/export family protein [Anderseniella sp.]
MRVITAFLILLCAAISSSAQAAYRLQPGDTIQVSVWQEPKLDRQLVVAPDGSVAMPLVGHVSAGGRSAQQVEKAIKAKLQTQYQSDLDVTVSLVAQPPEEEADKIDPTIFVMGEVNKPGEFVIKKRITLLQALAMGGGLSAFAAQRRIQVHRKVDGEDTIFQFDYRAFEHGRDVAGNIALRPGDVIVVPERGLFE